MNELEYYKELSKLKDKIIEQMANIIAFREDTEPYKKALTIIDYLNSEIQNLKDKE
jgi:hypothetical protein